MRSIDGLRQSMYEDDGSAKGYIVAAIGGGILALAAAGGILNWIKNGGVSAEIKTDVIFDAQTIADKITFPGTMRLIEVHGTSSTTAKIIFQISPKVNVFGKEVGFDQDLGSVDFPTSVSGTVGIEFDPLKSSETATLPNPDNSDKNYRIVIEENNGNKYAVIELDPAALSAVSIDVQTNVAETDVITDKFGSFLDSSTIEQITTGSQEWNRRNHKDTCAKNNTTFSNLEIGTVVSVSAISQGVSETILAEIKEELPDHPEAIASAEAALKTIFDPTTMQLRLVTDPNGPSPKPASIDDIPFNKLEGMNEKSLTRLIGLKTEYTNSVTYTFGNNYCGLTEEAMKSRDEYKALRENATPYDESQINRNAEQANG
jgi:hypothetical protein